jgi:hypothetical protein
MGAQVAVNFLDDPGVNGIFHDRISDIDYDIVSFASFGFNG